MIFVTNLGLKDYNRRMARHSHWAQIKLKKGATDKKRGKIFARHAHLIEIAARAAGGDPNTNASLRAAIDNARADNLPRENIDRAIKKGTGESKGTVEFSEITYEGYGPGGTALLIETFTDNKNRSSQAVRTIMQKHGGTMGAMGATSFLFDTKGQIEVAHKGDKDADELDIIDAGAEDLSETEDSFLVFTHPSELGVVRTNLSQKGFTIKSSSLVKIPKNTTEITDKEIAKKLLELVSALEEDDDVSNVYTSADMSDDLVNSL